MLRKALLGSLQKDVFTDIYGQESVKRELLSALLIGRHVILVGPPGVGKTTFAKNLVSILPLDSEGSSAPFVRLQGSPDLTVEDMLGDIDPLKALKFGPLAPESFTPGKIFKANGGVLFFDEINRCPEKLQNALLQVLEEGKATIGSYNVDLVANFILIATMNPEDFSGTERLSDVLLDRFDFVYVGYPETLAIEERIVLTKGKAVEKVKFPLDVLRFALSFVRSLRDDENLARVPGVRASLGLYERAQSFALLAGRSRVLAEDVSASLHSVLSHRIVLKPSMKYLMTPESFLAEAFRKFHEQHAREASEIVP